MATKKSKRNQKKLLQQKKKNISSSLQENKYHFNNVFLPTNVPLLDFCVAILEQVRINPELAISPDYYFSCMIIYWENKEYESFRESAFLLLSTIDSEIPSYIKKLIEGRHSFTFSERISFLTPEHISSNLEIAHPYYQLLDIFMMIGTKGRVSPYFNCFMRFMADIKKRPEPLSEHSYDAILSKFYEYFHRLLIEKDNELKKLTLFVGEQLYGDKSQSICFFLSYFNLNRNDECAIDYATEFLSAENLSDDSSSYKKSLCINTIKATIRCSRWNEYDEWMGHFESFVTNDDPVYQQLQEQGEKAVNKEMERRDHPVNPANIASIELSSIPTDMLLILTSVIDGCGGDWGLTTTEQRLRYTFPSRRVANQLLTNLLVNHVLKISISDFNALEDGDLYNFSSFINNCQLHLNIIGVEDTKVISLKVIKEEILRRNDIGNSLIKVWKKITIGYFYSTLEYYLSNVSDKWAQEFSLNESTIQRLEKIDSSARRLSYVAFSSVNSTVGFHELQSTGSKHTQNMLLHKIMKYLDFIESGESDYSKPRFDKAPILSIEKVIEELLNLDPHSLYNEIPSIEIIENCISIH